MNIAIIGTGNVGKALGVRLAGLGKTVLFGTRHPNDAKTAALLAEAGPRATAMTVENAVTAAQAVILATPWSATEQVVKSVRSWAGKILVDCTNPLNEDLSGLQFGTTTSAAEKIADWAVDAHVIKCFNMTGAGNMLNPSYDGQAASMFVCGNHQPSKREVLHLAALLGFDAVDAGELSAARHLEALAMLWIHLAYKKGMGPDIAFRLMKR